MPEHLVGWIPWARDKIMLRRWRILTAKCSWWCRWLLWSFLLLEDLSKNWTTFSLRSSGELCCRSPLCKTNISSRTSWCPRKFLLRVDSIWLISKNARCIRLVRRFNIGIVTEVYASSMHRARFEDEFALQLIILEYKPNNILELWGIDFVTGKRRSWNREEMRGFYEVVLVNQSVNKFCFLGFTLWCLVGSSLGLSTVLKLNVETDFLVLPAGF